MAEVVAAVVVVVAEVAGEAELVPEVAAGERESVRERAVALGTVTAVPPRGTMMPPVAAWRSVLVGRQRSPRPAASIAPLPQPDTCLPRPLEGPIRQAE